MVKVSNIGSNGSDAKSKYTRSTISISGSSRKIYFCSSENTWEKVANLSGAKKIIDEFEMKEIEKKAQLSNREVEKIVNEKTNKGETLFLVKWKGYKSE